MNAMMSYLLILFLFITAWPNNLKATVTPLTMSELENLCQNKDLDQMPLLIGGRVKPLSSHTNEYFRFLHESKPHGLENTKAFCLLSLQSFLKESAQDSFQKKYPNLSDPLIKIEHQDARKLLGIDTKAARMSTLISMELKLRSEIMKIKKSNAIKKELNKVYKRMTQAKEGVEGRLWSVGLALNDQNEVLWHQVIQLKESEKSFNIKEALYQSQALYDQSHQPKPYKLEHFYLKANLFVYSMIVLILAIMALVLNQKKTWPGLILMSLGIILQVWAVTMRVMISGRAPITNMYETVMFSGLGALILSFIIFGFQKNKSFLLAGLGYNVLCLFMMKFSNNMLDPSIAPLVPVLRDNFWLSTHVTTVILSYAALALSWILANIEMFKLAKGQSKLSTQDFRQAESLILTCTKVGVVLLSAGIILGGVWADYSWGRFWGWDPKETWSLIVLLYYIALLHARYTKWITPKRYIMASSLGFLTVMMAWFGVNYILATGLHSYGFSEGGAVFLLSFFAIQITFTTLVALRLRESKEFA